MLYYAGIGSRETPTSICNAMSHLAAKLADRGWILRSGHADGADIAFERGADRNQGKMEIFLPWHGFNGSPVGPNGEPIDPRYIVPTWTSELLAFVHQFHPAAHRLKPGALKLHARNGCQVLGRDLQSPVRMVICWTKNASGTGGTGQAIRIARSRNIPIFDLADAKQRHAMLDFIHSIAREESNA